MNAQPALFSIPELVQAVLLFLHPRDLLRVQRVCCLWKETTEHSLALQKKLFFRPVSDQTQEPEFNPLLREVFCPLFRLDKHRWQTSASPEDICSLAEWHKDHRHRERALYPEASWRRMYPIQPPTRIECVYSEGGCSCFYQIREGVIADHFQHLQDRGATVGLLWDVAIHLLDKEPESAVTVYWHMFPSLLEGENEGSAGALEKVEPIRNTVTVRVDWSNECYPPTPEPSGLSVGYFDPDIIAWNKEDSKESGP
jgi:hypothetical protein